ncbi:RHS repeat-associated core domain-containing protein [Longimicrobium terrae]|uniref:RHS repeat-associated protein n=1 Tax=Longimicrobium terrae TaxID=1639882 RepID=A0A841GYT2_9BACT|nr:RHS repeat-associated core domain-containing protein [Longimicrobium terrae]MBB4636556.1 RHS repeat-associated protein [Longimicrobium terrae]MBB6070920.1 RHS repeat-associated protein [Longimicrobium terrae]NNC28942.1 hypothetical protein [Longimicrobium terrae]
MLRSSTPPDSRARRAGPASFPYRPAGRARWCAALAAVLGVVLPPAAAAQTCAPSYRDLTQTMYAQVMEYGYGTPRVAGAAGSEYWAGRVRDGMTVKELVSVHAHSADFHAKFITGRAAADVLAQLYRHLLARDPDDAAQGLIAVGQSSGWDAVIDQIMNSTEYNTRFGLYSVPGDPVTAWDCARATQLTVAHNPSFRDETQGSANVSFTTPAYVSLDQPRSLSFSYSSGTVRPSGLVQIDMLDNSGDPPSRASIRLQVNGAWVTPETFYTVGTGPTRLSARYDASSYRSSAWLVTAVVRKYWTDGRVQEQTVNTRASIVNERTSMFGSGWMLNGFQRLTDQGDGVFITEGGVGLWFARTGCDPDGSCRYATPSGDFTTVRLDGPGNVFRRTYPDGSVVRFSRAGAMVDASDRFANSTGYGYDGAGRLTSVTDPVGKVTTLGYTSAGVLDWVQDPMGRRSITNSTQGTIWRWWQPDGSLALDIHFVDYDALGWIIDSYWAGRTQRANGDLDVAWRFTYDAFGRVASVTAPRVTTTDAGSTRPVVAVRSLEAAVLAAPGTGSATTPAARVRPEEVRVQTTDPRGNITRVAVDPFGAALKIEEPLGRTSYITRDRHGRVTRTDEPSGHYLTYTYTDGNLVKAKDNEAATEVNYEYEPVFHQLTHVSGSGTTEAWNTYNPADPQRKLLTTRSGTVTAPVTSFAYTTRGRVEAVTDPEGHGTFLTYDPVTGNRATTAVGTATGTYRRTAYRNFDRFGRDSAGASPGGEWVQTHYDVLNRVTRSISAAGGAGTDTTTYSYPTAVAYELRDAKGQTYRFNSNALGWTVSEVDPRNQTTSYGYDRVGNATSVTNRRGQVVAVAYDSLNRPWARTADGVQTTYSYGANDAWVQSSNPVSTIRTERDASGRPARTLTTLGGITYTAVSLFNLKGQRTGIDVTGPWSGVRSVRYAYGATGMLDSIVDFSGRTTRFSHNDDGQETGRVLPTGAVVESEFGSTHAGIMTRVDQQIGLTRGYSLDTNGRIGSILREYRDQYSNVGQIERTFQYNTRGFLTGFQEYKYAPGGSCAGTAPNPDTGACRPVPENGTTPELLVSGGYDYDRLGNRLDGGAVIDTGNRLTSWNGYTLTYDADGNLLQRSKPNTRTTTLQWNSLGQLTYASRTGTGGGSATYAYDPAGRRVQRTDGGGGVIRTLYDGDDILMELNGSGSPVLEYTYLPGVDNPLSVRSWAAGQNGAAYYYSLEQPGHVAGLISTTGQLANEYLYDPYGNLTYATEGVAQPLKYGARELDAAIGLYYLRARWYDPDLGRFVSEDPIGLAGGINPYAYIGSSPTNGTDPSGLCPECEDGITATVRGCSYSGWSRADTGMCQPTDAQQSPEWIANYMEALQSAGRGAAGGRGGGTLALTVGATGAFFPFGYSAQAGVAFNRNGDMKIFATVGPAMGLGFAAGPQLAINRGSLDDLTKNVDESGTLTLSGSSGLLSGGASFGGEQVIQGVQLGTRGGFGIFQSSVFLGGGVVIPRVPVGSIGCTRSGHGC